MLSVIKYWNYDADCIFSLPNLNNFKQIENLEFFWKFPLTSLKNMFCLSRFRNWIWGWFWLHLRSAQAVFAQGLQSKNSTQSASHVSMDNHRTSKKKKHFSASHFLFDIDQLFSSIYKQTLFEWARDHRIHHKFNETDSDPFDVHRGMFFAHCGFNMMHRHPNALEKEKKLDFSDILADPIVQFEIR
jgi:hypothetical protein